MEIQDPRLIEPPTRLSKSKIWQIQENYFTQTGIDVFRGEVPFYVSSNAFIGLRYAQLVHEFILDALKLNSPSSEPFYILEVGAGTGKFSFYFLRAFTKLLDEYPDIHFKYILSDVSEKSLDFCINNPSLAPYVEKGQLDFALFNVATNEDIYLKKAQQYLSKIKSVRPLIVIANYTFDCVKQDAFECHNGKVKEAQLEIRSRYKEFNLEKSRHLIDLRLKFHNHDIDFNNYYESPKINALLAEYAKTFNEKSGFVMMPIGAFELIDHLKSINPQVFFIVGDKGIVKPHQFTYIKEVDRVTYDGCYSFLLNFHALDYYVRQFQGSSCLTDNSNAFKVCLYSLGFSLDDYKQTRSYFDNIMEKFGPHEYCYIYDEFFAHAYRFNLRAIISFLRLSEYDPTAYGIVHDRLMELIPIMDLQTTEDLKSALEKIVKNVYHLSIGDNILNYIGSFYLKVGMLDKALEMFEKSAEIYTKSGLPYHNAAIVYEKQNKLSKALLNYEKAFSIDKRDEFANRKIHNITGRFYKKSLMPLFKAIGIFALIVLSIYLYSKRIFSI